MKNAILKSQIDKNNFLNSVNIVFFYYVHFNDKKTI